MGSLTRRVVLAVALFGSIVGLVGCLTTELNLGSAADAKVDTGYCGDWKVTWKDGDQTKSADLVIRNVDGKQYYVEWKTDGEKADRFSAFLVPVKSATFAQLSPMEPNGELSPKHTILRVQLEGEKLTMRHFDEDFFKDVTTDEQLRSKVESNLENSAMYKETATATRVSQQP
jgi:hypothetical protein